MSVYFCGRRRYLSFSVAGAALTAAFLVLANYVASPQSLWFIYALPPLLCWPVYMYFGRQAGRLQLSLLFAAGLIVYCTAINLLLTPHTFWAINAVYLIVWWPMCLYFSSKRQYKKFSVAGAVWTIAYLAALNLLTTAYPWALYAFLPVVYWPIAMHTEKRIFALRFSIIGAVCALLWYGALNLFLSPDSPWVIFVAYATLWWPLSLIFHGQGKAHWYAALMSAISIAFFAAVNLIYSPGALWAIYPAFALLWWPMTLFFARKHSWFGYSVAGSLLTIAFLAAVNLLTSPAFPWSLFPSLCLPWWPLAVYFAKKRRPFAFAIGGSLLITALLLVVNLVTSPAFLWSLFPSLCVLWWPLSVFFTQKKKPLQFALSGCILAITLFVSVNLLTSPGFLWSVFPAFAALWWPAGVFVYGARSNRPANQS